MASISRCGPRRRAIRGSVRTTASWCLAPPRTSTSRSRPTRSGRAATSSSGSSARCARTSSSSTCTSARQDPAALATLQLAWRLGEVRLGQDHLRDRIERGLDVAHDAARLDALLLEDDIDLVAGRHRADLVPRDRELDVEVVARDHLDDALTFLDALAFAMVEARDAAIRGWVNGRLGVFRRRLGTVM